MIIRQSFGAALRVTVAVSVAVVVTYSVPGHCSASAEPLVIYGRDNRKDVYEETNASRRKLADSVAAIVPAHSVAHSGLDSNINGAKYGPENNLCKTERFWDQVAPAFCTAVLVSDRIVATAGHCVAGARACASARFIFGFNIDSEGKDPAKVSNDAVYGCKRILHSEVDAKGADFALIELERPVTDRSPIRFARAAPRIGESVFIIGHPVGLPAKIADDANVRRNDDAFFVANLDSFGGNSGSPVFSDATHELSGLLVRGEQDFEQPHGSSCAVSFHCKNSLCGGEDVTAAAVIQAKLEEVLTSLAATGDEAAGR